MDKYIEEFKKRFGNKSYTASYQYWDLDPDLVIDFLTNAIQSAKKEAVEECIKKIEASKLGDNLDEDLEKVIDLESYNQGLEMAIELLRENNK